MTQDILIYLGIFLMIAAIIYVVLYLRPNTRKYLKYVWIVVPAAVLIFLVLVGRKKRDRTKDDILRNIITGMKDELEEAHLISAVEVSAAKQKNYDKLEELKKVTSIEDAKERRKRLIALAE